MTKDTTSLPKLMAHRLKVLKRNQMGHLLSRMKGEMIEEEIDPVIEGGIIKRMTKIEPKNLARV
jgi:hypothetical protein